MLAVNVMRFARLLRGAGFKLGPGRVLDALAAAAAVEPASRHDFYWALHGAFVDREDRRAVFREAFDLFWRDPWALRAGRVAAAPAQDAREGARISPRLAAALGADGAPAQRLELHNAARDPAPGGHGADTEETALRLRARDSYSADDVRGEMDFGAMTAAELAAAERAVQRVVLPDDRMRTRRLRADGAGHRPDWRTTLARSRRTGGEALALARRSPVLRQTPLVALVDISGSMSVYSRMLLRFLHQLSRHRRSAVHVFVFGTQLTDVSRALREADPDRALARVAALAGDWSGGTRVGPSFRTFNRAWSRRVLSRRAHVLLVTDGLERDPGGGLEFETARLRRSCRRLIWLNPHLRNAGYQPLTHGARIIARHATDVRAVHNLDSFTALAQALSGEHSPPRSA